MIEKRFKKKVKAQALKYVAECGKEYLLPFILLPTITVFVFWGHTENWINIFWLAVSFAVIAFRYFLIKQITQIKLTDLNTDYWGAMHTYSSLVSGILWGLAIFIFFVPDSFVHQLFILATIFGLVSAALILGSYWLPAYYAFSIPAVLSVFTRLQLERSTEYQWFSFFVLVYFFIILRNAKSQHKLAYESLYRKYENFDLLKKLNRQKKLAESANQSKSTLLAAASHDLRQPLHAIGLFAAALEQSKVDSAATKLISNINKSVSALDSLLISLLDISKLDADIIVPNNEHFYLDEIIDRISHEYETQAKIKNLQWDRRTNGNLGVSDPVLLETILRNLVSNAIRYTKAGKITISSETNGGLTKITVEDTGVGISQDDQKEIFREFFQVPNVTRDRAEGVGLGLAIVQRLLSLLNHDLQIDSIPQKGSRFSIFLPVGDVSQIKERPRYQQDILHNNNDNKVVLVIDDDPDILTGTRYLLEKWGFTVLCTQSQEEALAELKSSHLLPDVLLTDYRLAEGRTGIEATRALEKHLSQKLKVVFVSGDATKEAIHEIKSLGYILLHKPVSPGALRAALIHVQINGEQISFDSRKSTAS